MRERYGHIYLSPHLDDAVLSCGGQIHRHAQAGDSVLVLTVMAAPVVPWPPPSAFADELFQQFGLDAKMNEVRRAEDRRACEILGADSHHDDGIEALLRRAKDGRALYATREALFDRVAPGDEPLVDALAQRFGALPPAGQVVCPLGVGGHVDHQIVRRAAERAFGNKLAFYEDYPYANRRGALEPLLQPRAEWISETVRLRAADRKARCDAIMAYESQWRVLFGSRRALIWKNFLYLWRRGGERLWKISRGAEHRAVLSFPPPAG